MGICSVLTVIFIVLKLTGLIAWPWFWVLLPLLFEFVIDIGLLAIFVIYGFRFVSPHKPKSIKRNYIGQDTYYVDTVFQIPKAKKIHTQFRRRYKGGRVG